MVLNKRISVCVHGNCLNKQFCADGVRLRVQARRLLFNE